MHKCVRFVFVARKYNASKEKVVHALRRTSFVKTSSFSSMSSHDKKQKASLLTIDNINPCVKNVEYAVRGPIVIKATQLEKELSQGAKLPFDRIIKANIGDCHAMGQKPISFIRQVVAACTCPSLIEQNIFPSDVNKRAADILKTINGSTGCYSESTGLAIVRQHISEFIEQRDGYPCDPKTLIVTNGASSSVKLIIELFISQTKRSGVMIPIPQYPLYSATVDEFNMEQIGYYLDEDNNWGLNLSELKRSLNEAKKTCTPRCICVINPGNPTGQVLSYENIKEIIEFAMEEGLFLLADEVYQDNIYGEGAQFHSFKKVLRDMGSYADGFQMASFHSCSKGFMGECGLRGGYVEVIGIDDNVSYQLNKLQSAQLGSNVTGQIVMDCIVNPPKKGEPSYERFMQEKTDVLSSLKERAVMVYKTLNQIEGVSCNEVAGAMYAFPKIAIPQKAIEKAKSLGQEADFYFCSQLLDHTGICVVPGSGFRQKEGTYHFRMTILPPIDQLKVFLEKFRDFYNNFVEEHQ